jgi:hypothetical protein
LATLRTRYHESDIDYEVIFNRIQLDAEPVSDLVDPWFHNRTEETNKPWVGKIDRSAGTFELVQTNATVIFRYLEGNFFTLFIFGRITDDKLKRRMEVRYRLGGAATLFYLLAVLLPIGLAMVFVFQGDWDKLIDLIPWVLIFILFPAILLIVQLNRVEKEIEDLLGVAYEQPSQPF